MPKTISPTTILQFLHEVHKRLPQAWIKTGASYSATAEGRNYGYDDEDIIEYQIYVKPPSNESIQIRTRSVNGALSELEDAIKGFPALRI